ncbi:signal peptidase I [Nocardioides renjunii]|uniref:signal peptidase I n=1 Tax=Nocardioides renjunii TaxID=3095075 RepID=UPI002AFDF04E|nr:signal peptidase I [Nocardioides sp. S-34]WQQ21097.1 signal peptidase I [Nocardioides sp. S-34]
MTSATVLDADRAQPGGGTAGQAPQVALHGWARLAGVLAARMYRAFLLGLAVIALAPVLFGWGSYVVRSGSMEPSMQVGDVVVGKPWSEDQRIRVGRVFVYDDPATTRPHLMVHRIVELRDDGDYTTAGDANDVTDVTPLPRSDVRATAVLLVPYIGLPVTWMRSGDWLRLAAWLLLTSAALALALRRLDGERPRWGLLRAVRRWVARRPPHDGPGSGGPADGGPTHGTGPARSREGRVLRSRVPLVVVAGLVLLGTLTSTANAGFTGHTRNSGWTWATGAWAQPYVSAVLADQPFGFWLLDEPGGAAYASDRSGNNRTGQYYGSVQPGVPGALPRNPGTAVDHAGGRVVLGPQPVAAPAAYSIELWFRTTSTSRSYLAGFEDDRDAGYSLLGSQADRSVTMESSGRLTFGTWPGRSTSVTTSRSYNDGSWHHLVVTSTAARLTTIHVDGVPVVSGTTSTLLAYTGYWRVGQGSIGWLNTPAFDGEIDNVAIYHSALSGSRVAAHWAAR